MKGNIKMMKPESGFGFITPMSVEGQKPHADVFFHFSKVEGGDDVFKNLRTGDAVEFDVENGQKGPQATNVRPTMDA
jgi:CspA family cold shock protein